MGVENQVVLLEILENMYLGRVERTKTIFGGVETGGIIGNCQPEVDPIPDTVKQLL